MYFIVHNCPPVSFLLCRPWVIIRPINNCYKYNFNQLLWNKFICCNLAAGCRDYRAKHGAKNPFPNLSPRVPVQFTVFIVFSSFDIKCRKSRIYRTHAKLLLNSQQLVVFRHALASARRSGLDLAGVECDCKISDGRILRLS